MVYAKITITIAVNERLLTNTQQAQANKSDRDLNCEHPLHQGVERLVRCISENAFIGYFNYLDNGRNAVKISITE